MSRSTTARIRLLIAAASLFLIVLASACAGAAGSPSVGGPVDEGPGSQLPVDPAASDCAADGPDCQQGPVDVAYADVEVVADAQGTPRPVRWENAVTDPGSADVTVQWWSGVEPCYALHGVDVTETETEVVITVLEASIHPDEEEVACIEIAQAKQHTVTLTAPLGDRTVVDGA